MLLWLKAFHIIFVVTWFAGLFYLPRLFVYHSVTLDEPSLTRFQIMERRLFAIMSIGGILAVMFGLAMLLAVPQLMYQSWIQLKLALVALLAGYHLWCFVLMRHFQRGINKRSERWFRGFNEVPAALLIGIVLLAVLKPTF